MCMCACKCSSCCPQLCLFVSFVSRAVGACVTVFEDKLFPELLFVWETVFENKLELVNLCVCVCRNLMLSLSWRELRVWTHGCVEDAAVL